METVVDGCNDDVSGVEVDISVDVVVDKCCFECIPSDSFRK